MKSTLKNLLKLTSCTALMALLFSCTPATGGSTTGSGDTVTGTSGVTFSTTYTEPTLPASVGTDPFKGHTYRVSSSYSSSSSESSYTFGNNNELTYAYTYTSTTTSGTTTRRSGQKYSYSYDATTKALSVKITQVYQKIPGSTEYRWYTYAEYINTQLNITRSQLNEIGNTTIYTDYTDEQLRELIQASCIQAKYQFETINLWKAELDTSNNLVLRTSYYITAPSSLTNNSSHSVSYFSSQNSTSINFSLNILPTTSALPPNGSEGVIYSKGSVYTSKYSSGTPVSKNFNITNITSNTITAVEFSYFSIGSSTVYYLVSGGVTLQLNYTYALGNDNTLAITVTGSDDTTKDYLRTLLGDSTQTNPSITASSSTSSQTYTLVQ